MIKSQTEGLHNPQIDSEISYGWLLNQGFKNRLDYLKKLRTVKSAILSGIKQGLIVDSTGKDECRPDNPHHFHEYSVLEPNTLSLQLKGIFTNIVGEIVPMTPTFRGLNSVWLGHPCGSLVIFNIHNPYGKYLPLSRITSFEILQNSD